MYSTKLVGNAVEKSSESEIQWKRGKTRGDRLKCQATEATKEVKM